MVRLTPISLRLSKAETLRHARLVLAKVNRDDIKRRRIKYQAFKALRSLSEMQGLMSVDERARWQTECKLVQSFLKRISERGA
jgi:hypothetical protein